MRRAGCDSSWSDKGLRRSNPGGSSAVAVVAGQPAVVGVLPVAAAGERTVAVGGQPAAAGERTAAVGEQPAAAVAAAGAQPVAVEVEHKGQPADEIIDSQCERLRVIMRQVNYE